MPCFIYVYGYRPLFVYLCGSVNARLEFEPVQDPYPQQDQEQRQQDQQQPQEPRAARRRIRSHQDAPHDRAIIGIGSAAIIPPLVTSAPAPVSPGLASGLRHGAPRTPASQGHTP